MNDSARVYQFPSITRPDKFFRHAGWVYVLSNGLMDDIYKIGSTTRSVEQRMSELFTTGVPMPFDCMFAEWFSNCRAAESFIHDRLQESRLDGSREFFAASLSQIADAFMEFSAIGEEIPADIAELHIKRRQLAEASERVNGELVARGARKARSLEVPF